MRSRRSGVLVGLSLLAFTACSGISDMFSAHTDVVAKVGGRELPAERMAEWFVRSPSLTAQADVMTRVAHLWVNYVLFADRALGGDSLLDSTSVLTANWPVRHQVLIGRFHEQLAGKQSTLDSVRLDSVYRAGDLRLVRHILLRTDTGMTAAQRDAKRRQADRLRTQIVGGGSWERANQSNEDSGAKAQNGSLGVMARGEMVEPFEMAAYALGPGEVAPVVETPFGYHVVRRPALSEVREQFGRGVEQRLMARFDSTYLAELPQRLHLKVRSGAAAAVRDVARDPLAARQSRRVLASYDGGRFTAGDLARWFDVLPPRMAQQIPSASDDDLGQFVQSLARNAMLLTETEAAGVRLTDEEFGRLRTELGTQLGELRRALGLDSAAAADTASRATRAAFVGRQVDAYLERIAANPQVLVPVPPALADLLREGGGWRVYPAGVQRAFELARTRRAALDSAAGRSLPTGAAPPR